VVLLDVGDNIGGGSPGDSTVLLAEAIAQGVDGVVTAICDEQAVQGAVAAGLGVEVELAIGRTTPVSVGPRLRVKGHVTRITDGRFEDPTQTHGGFRVFEGGPTVRLTTPEGHEIILSSQPVPPFSPEQLRAVGIEPREQRVIVAKGVVAPRAGYEPVASKFLLVDSPGVTAADLAQFSYERRPTPLWPLDADARFDAPDETDRFDV
jgi:microcystin degradation protein MlrC